MTFAPIGISTYKRLDHLRNVIASLRANPLSAHSKLFIFSDGPQPGDEEAVAKVRAFASSVSGFGSLEVVERTENNRVRNNRGGIEYLLETFGRCIYLEEDVVVAPAFLGFMNEGLEYFEKNDRIFAICGYTPPVDFGRKYKRNSYLCSRFSAWGFGIWADRYAQIETDSISEKQLNPIQRWRMRTAGMDLVRMVGQMERNEIEALDVRINFTMAKLNKRVVCPTKSLTVNRGHDGTGIHCGTTDYFETPLDERAEIQWDFDHAKTNWRIDKTLYFYRGRHRKSRKSSIRYHVKRSLNFGE